MKRNRIGCLSVWICLGLLCSSFQLVRGAVVYEATTSHHHMKVIDEGDIRTLSFNGSMETRMSLSNPLQGHFEYTEYFQLPWLWNTNVKSVLMMGLGGGSTQRAYAHYYPQVTFHSVELDEKVLRVAETYFNFSTGPRQKVYIQDGRYFLRRTKLKFDAIMLDAYARNRYGSFIPYHLVTREFFEMAKDQLNEDGVVIYNVIGSLRGFRTDILGAVYKTMKSVFPQVYLFPANGSQNVILLASRSPMKVNSTILHARASALKRQGLQLSPGYRNLINSFSAIGPFSASRVKVLTDDFAPVDGLLQKVRR